MSNSLNKLAKSTSQKFFSIKMCTTSHKIAKEGNPLNSQSHRFIICECGEKILLTPELDEMARSIEAHATKHEKKEKNPMKASELHCHIERLLTQLTLVLVAGV
jgi:hypothetical protein